MTLLKAMVIGALLPALTASLAQAQGKWRRGAPMPEAMTEVVGTDAAGRVLVYGGQGEGGVPLGHFWAYDPAQDAWRKLVANPTPVHHAAVVGVGRKMYVFGGFRLPDSGRFGWYPVAHAWVFDLDTEQWSPLPPLPTARGSMSAVAVNGKIYVVGGGTIPRGTELPDGLVPRGPVELLATTEAFDVATGSWTVLAPMPTARNHHNVVTLDDKIYVIGGRVGSCFSGGLSTNVWMNEEYDIATDAWRSRAPMPTARSGAGAAVKDGKIHVLGGEGWIDDLGGVFRAHEVYDPKTDVWTRAERMLTARQGFAIARVGASIYTIGGQNNAAGAGKPALVDVNEIYEP
jgi:N-acetylneuraminic acid mutarotase